MQALFFGPLSFWHALVIIILFFAIAGYTLWKQIKNKKIDRMLCIMSIFFIIPMLTMVVFNLWNIKFFIIGLPWLLIISAYLLNYYFKNKLVIVLLIILLTTPGLARLNEILPLSDWSTINNCIEERKKDNTQQIFIYDYYMHKMLFDRYYKSSVPALGYFPSNDYENWDRQIITTNYLMYKHPDEEILKWMEDRKLSDYDEIFVMQDNRADENDIPVNITSVLNEKKYSLIDRCYARIADGKKIIYHYAKPARTDDKK